ncbi:hypothetical protein [Aporhodopirellula aestuarii]|uniref:Uncharacterized protein n=1 Tax=Aporhodopirellula aestuarii TaxID=2950107 RepID=A0ABT0U981_9BACT|nr:hypothetical protein [Aporhodopirellula aestuarii]MCM2373426.1 hypothetical protein [Aporhodopirellula aestuarii]
MSQSSVVKASVMQQHIRLRYPKSMLLCVVLAGVVCGCSQRHAEVDAVSETAPSPAVLQEMHDLLSERTRATLKRRYFAQFTDDDSSAKKSEASDELKQIEFRLAEIATRLETIHRNELGPFERVAEGAGLECHEEPLYGESSYGIILYAVATGDISAGELLLFHAEGVYRTTGSFQPLTTDGQGFYFHPNANIPKGERFVVACIQDAPDEIENVKNGFMPDSDRARDPRHAYQTRVFGSDGEPIPPPRST